MSDICVPTHALRNHLAFKDWYDKIAYQLFHVGDRPKVRFDAKHLSHQENIEFIESVMKMVNSVFYGDSKLIDYKTKKRKFSSRKTDVVSTTCVIILNNFKITYKALGDYIGINHSSMIYYVKRHASYCMSSDYRAKYLRVLTLLQYERVIPTTKDPGHKPQLLVSTLLSGVK